jgi:hypothetical protein
VVGGILGIFDGLSALISAPNDPAVNAGIVGIVIGSTVTGVITGALIGWFAGRAASMATTMLFGLAVGVALAFVICLLQKAAGQPPYYWQIMLPGGILGLIVGYATFRAPASAPVRAAPSR